MKMILNLKVFLSVICCLVIVSQADPINYKDCGTTGLKINYFDIVNCKALPCNLKKNTNQTLLMSFNSLSDYTNLNNALFGVISGVKVPFPLADPSVCHWGVNCPIKNGSTYLQNFTLPVLSVYPSISLFAQMEMQDSNGKPVMCVLFPVKISS